MKNKSIDFKKIIEQSPDPVCITDIAPLEADGPEVIYINEAFSRAHGNNGQPLEMPRGLLHLANADNTVSTALKEALATRQATQIMFNKAADGAPEHWVELTLLPVRDDQGEVTCFAAIERDINNRQQLSQLLATPTGKDRLTGLLDRNGLEEVLAQEFSLYSRNQQVYSVILIDIDGFRKINDYHGERSTNRAITGLADVIEEVFRLYDQIARIKADQFCILLRQTNLQQALLSSIRLRQTVQSRSFPVDHGSVNLTVSIGLSDVLPGDINFDDILGRAAEALHTAKTSGGDQVLAYRHDLLNQAKA